MLQLLLSALFGVVEGITEWLPISSTGHLILLNQFLTLDVSEAFYSMYEVVIQLGAILAVLVLFFDKLNPFVKGRRQSRRILRLWSKVIVGVLPSAVLGVLLDDWFDAHFYNYVVVALMLILYGIAFIVIEKKKENTEPNISSTDQLDWKTVILIGCFQCLALIPGTSRSGSTIIGAILLGVSRVAAAEFSFFLAIPTMLGASALKVLKFILKGTAVSGLEIGILAVGCIVSFVVSLLAIRFLMNYVKKHSFSSFGIYRIVLGAAVLGYFMLSGSKIV